MRILFIGDLVGRPGRSIVKDLLPQIRKDEDVDLVIASADNLAGGRGATRGTINETRDAGVDFFTGGDHIFHHREFEQDIEDLPIVRPANYPGDAPGVGYAVIDLGSKGSVLLINLMGRTAFGGPQAYLEDPFTRAAEILEEFSSEEDLIRLVDFHAEATSEKKALGFYLDGRVDGVFGTHTHVPTCDARILPLGTAYVTDVGMSGNIESVLGVKKDIIIELFLTARLQKFEWENTGTKAFRSVLLNTDSNHIKRLDFEK
ncbi:metallophosphoesterase [candidate division WWE3 bacterium]|nr:metallophosphoesterase [candidate division WWE3 bacterium]